MTRQQEFELHTAEMRRKWEHSYRCRQQSGSYYSSSGSANTSNTLAPQEDVVESRRSTRNRVVMSMGRPASTRTLLMENLFLLVVLGASIFGLYLLSIYLLNQSTY